MIVNEVSKEPFCCFYNDKVYKLNWIQSPKLHSKYSVDVGIDQSSTSTGICIQSPDLLFLTELPREHMSVSEYKKALKKELDCLLRTLHIHHFIYEKHKHITPLVSVINEITATLKSYTKSLVNSDVKIVGISPPVWRKGFFKDTGYEGDYSRTNIKKACVDTVIKEKPKTLLFKDFSHKDFDAYEAYGIINGYLKLNYAQDGTRIVNTSMEYRNGRNYKYFLVKCKSFEEQEQIKKLQQNYGTNNTPIILANKELLLENSLNRIMGEYEQAILVIREHSEFPSYTLEVNKPYNVGDMFIAFVSR